VQENGVKTSKESLRFTIDKAVSRIPDSAALHPGCNKKTKFTGRLEFKKLEVIDRGMKSGGGHGALPQFVLQTKSHQ
jgi:hypothetical protein